tara:strand:+ start:497 stop:856 length:360 start_codon:yes stop_codon:yes gene_type:complete
MLYNIQNYFILTSKFKTIILLFLFLLCIDFSEHSNKASSLDQISPLIDKCLNFYSKDICRKALIKIHSLQNKALNNGKYSCQTRLLGLEAELIMLMYRESRVSNRKELIDEVSEVCKSL